MRNNMSLKEKMESYRNITDYGLLHKSYVLAMVDGHCFSKLIKKKYKLPFDDSFIDKMNRTAAYVCQQVQGCKIAYTQSDEISFLITDFDSEMCDAYFDYRLCKLQSLIASYATSMFNQLCIEELSSTPCSKEDLEQMIKNYTPVTFDCKVWTVPTSKDAFCWFLYRQNDCIRNSKQQAAQTFLPHKRLENLNADMQVELLNEEKGIDWNQYDNGKKYGRIIYKEPVKMTKVVNGEEIEFERNVWTAHNAVPFKECNELKSHIPQRDTINNVYILESEYNNGNKEINGVFRSEENAKKLQEWMAENPLEDVYVEKSNIRNFCIL